MSELLYPLLLLACPIGMGLMMLLMGMHGRRDRDKHREGAEREPTRREDLAELRAEQARISERIAAIERAQAPHDTASR
jgi:hypothetical protein